jgi:hypothetical protein
VSRLVGSEMCIRDSHYDFMGEWMETTIEKFKSGSTNGN